MRDKENGSHNPARDLISLADSFMQPLDDPSMTDLLGSSASRIAQ